MDRFEQAFATGLLRGLEKTAEEIDKTADDAPRPPLTSPSEKTPKGFFRRLGIRAKAGVRAVKQRVGAPEASEQAGKLKEMLKGMWGAKGEKGAGWRRAAMVGLPSAGLAGAGAAGAGLASLLRKKSKEE